MAALFERHPCVGVGLVVPLTFDLLLRIASCLSGWPNPAALLDRLDIRHGVLVLIFFVGLRTERCSPHRPINRPGLCRRDVSVRIGGAHISVPKP